MGFIDCETRETTRATVAAAFNITPEEVDQLLATADPLINAPENWKLGDPLHFAGRAFLKAAGREPDYDGICYFHFTRALPQASFASEGIRPNVDRLDAIWAALGEMLPPDFNQQRSAEIRVTSTLSCSA